MATLKINVENGGDAHKLADTVNMTKGVAKITMKKNKTMSKWDTAIAEGAVSNDEFIGELHRRIDQWPDNNA